MPAPPPSPESGSASARPAAAALADLSAADLRALDHAAALAQIDVVLSLPAPYIEEARRVTSGFVEQQCLAMNPIFQAALEIERVCRDVRFAFCFIGGRAVHRWGGRSRASQACEKRRHGRLPVVN